MFVRSCTTTPEGLIALSDALLDAFINTPPLPLDDNYESTHPRIEYSTLAALAERYAPRAVIGHPTPILPPYGYGLDPEKKKQSCADAGDLVRNAVESDVVRGIFKEFVEGRSLRKIAERLDGKSIPGPNGEKWCGPKGSSLSEISAIICNPLYDGRIVEKQAALAAPIEIDAPNLRVVHRDVWLAAYSLATGLGPFLVYCDVKEKLLQALQGRGATPLPRLTNESYLDARMLRLTNEPLLDAKLLRLINELGLGLRRVSDVDAPIVNDSGDFVTEFSDKDSGHKITICVADKEFKDWKDKYSREINIIEGTKKYHRRLGLRFSDIQPVKNSRGPGASSFEAGFSNYLGGLKSEGETFEDLAKFVEFTIEFYEETISQEEGWKGKKTIGVQTVKKFYYKYVDSDPNMKEALFPKWKNAN